MSDNATKTLTEDELTLLAIKGVISGLDPEQRAKFDQINAEIRALLKDSGDAGVLAISLIGAELQMEAE